MVTKTNKTFHIKTTLVLAIVYSALWALLSDNQGWMFGALFVTLAVVCSLATGLSLPAMTFRPVPALLWFFITRMIVGGTDVARRTLGRRPDVRPGWVKYQLADDSVFARLLLSAITGLLPGTLAARIDGSVMLVHALDTEREWQSDIRALEDYLRRIFPAVEARA